MNPGKTDTPPTVGITPAMVNQILSTWNGRVDQLTPEQFSAILNLTVGDLPNLTPSQEDFFVSASLNLARRHGAEWIFEHVGLLRAQAEFVQTLL